MENKLILQDLIDLLGLKTKQSKRTNEMFVKVFFDTIIDGLKTDRFVKVKGWGTFKLVTVGERESININTGERFQISEHYKVSFTPESSLKEFINKPFSHFQTTVLNSEVTSEELENIDDEMAEMEETLSISATPQTEFDSTSSVSSQLSPASAPIVGQKPDESSVSLTPSPVMSTEHDSETLLDDSSADKSTGIPMEQGDRPANQEDSPDNNGDVRNISQEDAGTSQETEDKVDTPSNKTTEEAAHAVQSSSEKTEETPDDSIAPSSTGSSVPPIAPGSPAEPTLTIPSPIEVKVTELPPSTNKFPWMKSAIWTFLVLLALAVGYLLGRLHTEPQHASPTPTAAPRPTLVDTASRQRHTPKPASATPTTDDSAKQSSTTQAPPALPHPTHQRPQSHVVQKGETLMDIARKYYGSKRYVNLIIRYNDIDSPDYVRYGTRIKLPPIESDTTTSKTD